MILYRNTNDVRAVSLTRKPRITDGTAPLVGYTAIELTPSQSGLLIRLLLCLRSGSISYYFHSCMFSFWNWWVNYPATIIAVPFATPQCCHRLTRLFRGTVPAKFQWFVVCCYGRNAEEYSSFPPNSAERSLLKRHNTKVSPSSDCDLSAFVRSVATATAVTFGCVRWLFDVFV